MEDKNVIQDLIDRMRREGYPDFTKDLLKIGVEMRKKVEKSEPVTPIYTGSNEDEVKKDPSISDIYTRSTIRKPRQSFKSGNIRIVQTGLDEEDYQLLHEICEVTGLTKYAILKEMIRKSLREDYPKVKAMKGK